MKEPEDLAGPNSGPPDRHKPGAGGLPQWRERAISLLSDCFARNLLELEEFERRVELAHRAESVQELERLISDIPTELLRDSRPQKRREAELAEGEQPLFGIMSSRSFRGNWLKARNVSATCLMSSLNIDFREVPLPAGVIELRVFTAMSSLRLTVPEGLPVQLDLVPIMSDCREGRGVKNRIPPGGPGLHITGFALMSEVRVRAR